MSIHFSLGSRFSRIISISGMLLVIHLQAMDLTPQKTSEIKHISVKDKSELDENGYMSRSFLTSLLNQATTEDKLPALFANLGSDAIKRLAEEQKGAIWKTTQLFLVKTPNNHSFIIKGMGEWEEEIKNLTKGVQLGALKKYWYPNENYSFPQLVFPIAYISYSDQNNKKHYLSIMPTAPGISLDKLFENFVKNPSDRLLMKTIAQAYFDVGATMARFYKETDKKITHGDLHQGNIFYNPTNHAVTLIDNERIAKQSDNGICEDIAFLLMKSLYVTKWTKSTLIKNLIEEEKLKNWYSLFLPNFIAGYLSIFKHKDLNTHYEFLKNCIVKYKDQEKNLKWYTDETMLHFSHAKYMQPIFDSLKNSTVLFEIDTDPIHKEYDEKKTLLHQAALNGESYMIWPLVSAGLNVNARDIHGNTPLHEASYYNHVNTIKALVRAGADLKAQTYEKKETPLDKAVYNNSVDAIATLKDYLSRSR